MHVVLTDLPPRTFRAAEPPHVVVQSSPERTTFAEEKHREFWTTDVLVPCAATGRPFAVRYCVRLRLGFHCDEPVLAGSTRDAVYKQCVPLPLVDKDQKPVLDKEGKQKTVDAMVDIPGSQGLPHPILGYILVVIQPRKINGRWESEVSDPSVCVPAEKGKNGEPVLPDARTG